MKQKQIRQTQIQLMLVLQLMNNIRPCEWRYIDLKLSSPALRKKSCI